MALYMSFMLMSVLEMAWLWDVSKRLETNNIRLGVCTLISLR